MVEIKLEAGDNVASLGRMVLLIIVGLIAVSVVIGLFVLVYFMFINPLST